MPESPGCMALEAEARACDARYESFCALWLRKARAIVRKAEAEASAAKPADEEPEKSPAFKVGDRVRNKRSGWYGVVTMINPCMPYPILADYGNKDCHWHSEYDLESKPVAEEPVKPAFKVGDRVRVKQSGLCGVVATTNPSVQFGIRVDLGDQWHHWFHKRELEPEERCQDDPRCACADAARALAASLQTTARLCEEVARALEAR